jgi:L-asparaginase / beta-aspartyl-peptidase
MTLARIALHGGAGVIDRQHLGPEREARYRGELQRIAAAAWARLETGASALDVVESAVRDLENCPLFNAGHGAVLNHDGVVEQDAAIMDGRQRAAGAVAAALRPRNPIALARRILDDGQHVMLVGPNADRFAESCGIPRVDNTWFITPDRQAQLEMARAEGRVSLDHDQHAGPAPVTASGHSPDDKRGTVGAVARDAHGHLAAATSTGGMTNKRPGRVGDSPLIGAGTWADDATVCVSATGHGEYFIRCVVGHDIHARIAYGGQDLRSACGAVLDRVAAMGGDGGLIAIAANGEVLLPFNSAGMYRAWVAADGVLRVAIYGDDD